MLNIKSSVLSISTSSCQIHPQADAILAEARKVAQELGIYEADQYASHHTMTPYLFEQSPLDRTVDATVFFSILYYLDDYFGEDTADAATLDAKVLFHVWMSGEYTPTSDTKIERLYAALAYISKTMQSKCSPSYFQRYTNYLLLHLQHSLQPVDYQTVKEYIQTRMHFGGMYPTIGMIEYVYDCYITDEIREQLPILTKLEKSCALIGALSNDIFSYHKEAHSRFNLLNAYLEEDADRSLEEAVSLAVESVNNLYAEFLSDATFLKRQITELEAAEQTKVQLYLQGLQQLIAASYHWQVNTNRYRAENNVFEDMRTPLSRYSSNLSAEETDPFSDRKIA